MKTNSISSFKVREWFMAKRKTTSPEVASKASETLKSNSTGKKSKTAAASVLAQTKVKDKTTTKSAAKAASDVLKDGRTSSSSKKAAGSALSQKTGGKASKSSSTGNHSIGNNTGDKALSVMTNRPRPKTTPINKPSTKK